MLWRPTLLLCPLSMPFSTLLFPLTPAWHYLDAFLPSPEAVRIDVSSISLPNLTKLGLLLRHSHAKPYLFCDVLKTVPGLPKSGLLSQLRLVALLTQQLGLGLGLWLGKG
jgi:hypothetical protein